MNYIFFCFLLWIFSEVNIANNDRCKSHFISSINKDNSSYYRMSFRKTFGKRFKCLFFVILDGCCFCNKAIYRWFMKRNNLKQKIKKWCYRIFNIFVFIVILILGAFLKQKLFKNIRLYK